MVTNEKEKDEVTFEVVEHLGVVASYPTGWKKELNKVAWNGNAAKFDSQLSPYNSYEEN